MKRLITVLVVAGVAGLMIGCGGNGEAVQKVATAWGTGWFAHLFLIVAPLLIILVKLFRESEATSDSLISLEGQLRRLNNKIDDLEAGLKGGGKKKE